MELRTRSAPIKLHSGHEEQQYLKNSSVPIAIPFLASGLQSIYANL
jgi:hypothetical protein